MLDKKSEMLKSLNTQVTPSTHQHQQSLTHTTVNTSNSNNHNRKSETVTSSLEELGNQHIKSCDGSLENTGEPSEDISLVSTLGHDRENALAEANVAKLSPFSEGTSCTENLAEIENPSKETPEVEAKNQAGSVGLKKVSRASALPATRRHQIFPFQSLVDYESGDSEDDNDDESETTEPIQKKVRLI
jgi:hypothetical protein